jgi:hypothetical protein
MSRIQNNQKLVKVIGIKNDKTKLIDGKEYMVSEDVAKALIKSKRAKAFKVKAEKSK